MLVRWLCVLSLAGACIPDPPAKTAPKPSEAPALGDWTQKAKASLEKLGTLDPKSPDADKECVTARTAVRTGQDRSEAGIAALGDEVEKRCMVAEAWGHLLRSAPQADGPNRAAYCGKVVVIMKRLEDAKADVTAIREQHGKVCKKPVKFEATGELAKIDDLDPRGKPAITLCRDARTDALQVKLRDRTGGEEQERTLNVVCALPDLFSSLESAASAAKPEAREIECVSAKVWISVLTKNKRLKGKNLSKAKSAFGKTCKKWSKVDPMKDLAKLEKLDPKTKDARGICARSAAFVRASDAAGQNKDLAASRDKTCARAEGWALALDASCATAADLLERKRPLIDAAELASMSAEQRDRCK